jgi:hypothetical protein
LWNDNNNQTIMLALYHGGTIASFKIQDNYQMENIRPLPVKEEVKEVVKPVEPKI